jgi:hypothetical protein
MFTMRRYSVPYPPEETPKVKKVEFLSLAAFSSRLVTYGGVGLFFIDPETVQISEWFVEFGTVFQVAWPSLTYTHLHNCIP